MKKILSIILLFQVCFLQGQNLVQNPSFETYTACPISDSQVADASGWIDFRGTSDYYNSCASSTSYTECNVPSNFSGYQFPHTGNAYCGVITFDKAGFYREAMGSLLSSQLIIGQKYYVSFYTSLTLKAPNDAYVANNIGAKFTTISYNTYQQSNQIPINNIAQLHYPSLLTDTTNWTQVTGSFIADSTYQYIVIGNFFDDQHTDTSRLGHGFVLPIESYYFIDDVCVSTDSVYANTWAEGIEQVKENKGSFTAYPNPFGDGTTVKYYVPDNAGNAQIVFYDEFGTQLKTFAITETGNGQLNITAGSLAAGTYSYSLLINGKAVDTKKMIKQ